MKKADKTDRLAALREKLAKTDTGGGGKKGFWAPDEGENVIRIMDGVGDMEYFFQEVGTHWLPGDKHEKVYCPAFTSGGELECPICETVSQLYRGDKESKEMASELRVQRQYWMNVIVRSREADGPLIYTPGVQVFQQLIAIVNDPEYGDIMDDDEGIDININRKGTGLDTEYTLLPKRKASKLHASVETIDKWYEDAKDLSYAELTDDPEEDKELSEGHVVYILPYDRIANEFNLSTMGEDDPEEPEVEAPAAHPAKRAVSERRARR